MYIYFFNFRNNANGWVITILNSSYSLSTKVDIATVDIRTPINFNCNFKWYMDLYVMIKIPRLDSVTKNILIEVVKYV